MVESLSREAPPLPPRRDHASMASTPGRCHSFLGWWRAYDTMAEQQQPPPPVQFKSHRLAPSTDMADPNGHHRRLPAGDPGRLNLGSASADFAPSSRDTIYVPFPQDHVKSGSASAAGNDSARDFSSSPRLDVIAEAQGAAWGWDALWEDTGFAHCLRDPKTVLCWRYMYGGDDYCDLGRDCFDAHSYNDLQSKIRTGVAASRSYSVPHPDLDLDFSDVSQFAGVFSSQQQPPASDEWNLVVGNMQQQQRSMTPSASSRAAAATDADGEDPPPPSPPPPPHPPSPSAEGSASPTTPGTPTTGADEKNVGESTTRYFSPTPPPPHPHRRRHGHRHGHGHRR
uniref:C3H1-type domain-containing protein n=1 Tax=Oryza meridionalis TaxID=40149 RepID=A0A0E0DAQ9_9ORYZ